jgi:hypothetical protein
MTVSTKLEFCLTNKLIPYLNHNERSELIITSDFITDLKRNKIDSISSLAEVGRMINGFEYGQKKLAGKNVRSANGSKNNFLEFLN